MKKVIDWIKSNLAIVISGAVTAIALVFLVLGMMDDQVPQALQTDNTLAGSLTSLRPINESVITAALAEQERQQRQLTDMLTRIESEKTYKPLIDTVFPAMSDNDKFSAPYDFRKAFRAKQASFMNDLNAKDRVSSGGREYGSPSRRSGRTGGEHFLTDLEDTRGGLPMFRPGRTDTISPSPSGEKPQASRDDLILAQGIYLYASVDNLDSQNAAVKAVNEGTGLLTLEQMWMAQISLWIQEDIVAVLKNLNEEALQGLDQEKRWVGYLPIKHLKLFSLDDFYHTSASGGTVGRKQGRSQEAFVSPRPATVDAIRFNLTLVVDANSLLRVIERISQSGFYTLLEPSKITAVQIVTASSGYVYGSAPAVEVEMLWEACFLRSAYDPIMPTVVKDMFTSGATETSIPTRTPAGNHPFSEIER